MTEPRTPSWCCLHLSWERLPYSCCGAQGSPQEPNSPTLSSKHPQLPLAQAPPGPTSRTGQTSAKRALRPRKLLWLHLFTEQMQFLLSLDHHFFKSLMGRGFKNIPVVGPTPPSSLQLGPCSLLLPRGQPSPRPGAHAQEVTTTIPGGSLGESDHLWGDGGGISKHNVL